MGDSFESNRVKAIDDRKCKVCASNKIRISRTMTAFCARSNIRNLDFSHDGRRRCAALRRLKISPILGFLGAGVLLVPTAPGHSRIAFNWLASFALGNVEQIAPVAEFGVVFLLFMIGLELSWQRLAIIGRLVSGSAPCSVRLGRRACRPDLLSE